MSVLQRVLLFVFVLAFIVLSSAVFVVDEGERALVLRLGEIVKDRQTKLPRVYGPGLHFKSPFVTSVRDFDIRIQNLSSEPFNVLTAQQTYLVIDYYVKWRIADLSLFYTRTGGDAYRADRLLEQHLNDVVRAEFGQHTSDAAISTERAKIMRDITQAAQRSVREDLGIEVIDVRLQSIFLPPQVMQSVFKRMAAERKQFAENKRAEGRKIAEGIRAQADQQAVVTKSKAQMDAARIRAEGERKAAELYAKSYGKDKAFYQYYRSMEAYRHSFNKPQDVVVLRPDNEFFRYFNQAQQAK